MENNKILSDMEVKYGVEIDYDKSDSSLSIWDEEGEKLYNVDLFTYEGDWHTEKAESLANVDCFRVNNDNIFHVDGIQDLYEMFEYYDILEVKEA